ncbi:MAG: hypothetical protein JWM74_752 [Myxococcaceae bacterium]|nr:hypothetical protein [Myxococcaceae bacterium]
MSASDGTPREPSTLVTRMATAGLCVCVLGVLAACSSAPQHCTGYGSEGMSVTVLRASNQAHVCGAKVVIRDGDYQEELAPEPVAADAPCGGNYWGGNRVGTYRVEITHRDYEPAVVEPVAVTNSGGCHLDTAVVSVSLEGGPADTFR